MLNYVFREARLVDIPEIAGLLMELFSLEADFNPDRNCQETALELLVNDTSSRLFVMETDSQIIGTASWQRHISTSCGGYAAIVEDIIIKKEYRSQGYGKIMLDALMKQAGKEGLLRLSLLADRNNTKAIQFYKKNNWTMTNLIPLFTYL